MKIDISSMRQSGLRSLHFHFVEAMSIEMPSGARLAAPVELELELRHDSAGMTGVGVIRTELRCSCARCLNEFEQELQQLMEFKLLDQEPDTADEQAENWAIICNDEIDLRDMVKEVIILSMPLRPLCSLQCRGLCPGCGVDLNHEQCHCQGEVLDPRWEKLKQLIDREGGN